MKIGTHWTPPYKVPHLVSCNALLGGQTLGAPLHQPCAPPCCREGLKFSSVLFGIMGRLVLHGVEYFGSHYGPDRVDRIMSVESFRHEARQGSAGSDVPFGQLILDNGVDGRVKVWILADRLLRLLVVLTYCDCTLVIIRLEPTCGIRRDVGVVFHAPPIMRRRRWRCTLLAHRRSAQHRGVLNRSTQQSGKTPPMVSSNSMFVEGGY